MGKRWTEDKAERRTSQLPEDENEFPEQFRTTQLIFHEQGGKKVPKLKEPRNLYALTREEGLQTSARWPVECHVMSQRPRHIAPSAHDPEPFYTQAETIPLPPEPTEVDGKVVYDNPPTSNTYFLRSRVGGSRLEPKPFYRLSSASDNTLIFESRFESGNLARAVKIDDYDYQLWLQFDMYTKKHTQWFYFRVHNTRPGVKYRFTILNFMKSGSLYNSGMRPLMYSEKNAANNEIGWQRVGDNIKYYKNTVRREDTTKERYYYSLTWTCQFPYENDTCYFAHCYPYTYSDLQDYLHNISNDPQRSRYCKQRVLCRTLAGNFVYLLTITNPSKRPADSKSKRAVVITARVHPGETNSSWMMKGMLDYLTSNSPDAKLLRDVFIFKIVPMLNPDGVVVGNYRCSLTGRDLNRNYKTVLRDSYPSVWNTRTMIAKLLQEREIVVYCDLHGHSRKKNVFMYGCEQKKRGSNHDLFRQRVFPLMMSKNASSKFSFKGCKFKVQKSKEGTGRIVMWNLGIRNSFTMEATFSGSALGSQKGFHFSPADFESMSYHLCDTLLDYCDPDETKVILVIKELELLLKSKVLEKMKAKGNIPQNFTVDDIDLSQDYGSDIESSTGGSDSSVSDGLPMHLVHAVQFAEGAAKKKKLKTRKERNRQRDFSLRYRHGIVNASKESNQNTTTTTSKQDLLMLAERAQDAVTADKNNACKLLFSKPFQSRRHQNTTPHNCCSDSPTAASVLTSPNNASQEQGEQIDYLEAVTNACLVTGLLAQQKKGKRYVRRPKPDPDVIALINAAERATKKEMPHLRYTARKGHKTPTDRTKLPHTCPNHWANDAQGYTASDTEDGFTFSYLVNHLDQNAEHDAPSRFVQSKPSLALDLARQITSYNSRQKDANIHSMQSPTRQLEHSSEGLRLHNIPHDAHTFRIKQPQQQQQPMPFAPGSSQNWYGNLQAHGFYSNQETWTKDKDPGHYKRMAVNRREAHSVGQRELMMDSSLQGYPPVQGSKGSKLTSNTQLKPLVKTHPQKDRGILLHSAMFRPADSVRRRSSLSDESPPKNKQHAGKSNPTVEPAANGSSTQLLSPPEKKQSETFEGLKQKLLDSQGMGQLVSHALNKQFAEVDRVINGNRYTGSSDTPSDNDDDNDDVGDDDGFVDDDTPDDKLEPSSTSQQNSKERTQKFPEIRNTSPGKLLLSPEFMRSNSFHIGGESLKQQLRDKEQSLADSASYFITKTKSSPELSLGRDTRYSERSDRTKGSSRKLSSLGVQGQVSATEEFREFHSTERPPYSRESMYSRPVYPPSYMLYPRTKYTGAEIVYKSHLYRNGSDTSSATLPLPLTSQEEQFQDFGTVAQRAVIHPPKARHHRPPKNS